jgi:hypothetical protein
MPIHHGSPIEAAVETLAENRLLPHWIMCRRPVQRNKFLRSLGIQGGVGAEIGVQKGFFSHALLHTLRPRQLHLIDPWHLLGDEWEWATGSKSTQKALANIRYWFRHDIASQRVVVHVGFDEAVLQTFPDGFFDWVYLDTSHSYDQTRQELTLLANKVKRSGVILGDDWFSELSHPFHGQHVAINEFVDKGAYQVVYANDTDHQWAIRAIRGQK